MRLKRDLATNNKTHAQFAMGSLRKRAEIQNDETAVQKNRSRDTYARHRPSPVSIRWLVSKHPVDADLPEARCFFPDSSEKRTKNTRLYRIRIDSEPMQRSTPLHRLH